MDSGVIFGLKASFDKIETVSKLFPSPSKNMKIYTNNNGNMSQDILTDFSDKVNKMNKMTILSVATGDTIGSFFDVFA